MSFGEYLSDNAQRLLFLAWDTAVLVVFAVALGAVIGITLGVLSYQRPAVRGPVIATVGLILTIPSLALYALLISVLGLGAFPVFVALTLYSLMPITRNTVTGLLGVDRAIVEAAQGMGVGRWRRLFRIELPLAWPVILTGIRVSMIIGVGIAAIGAIVNGPGLGQLLTTGLARIGTPVALNMALAGTIGVALVGILLDGLVSLIARLTTPRGARA